MKKPAGWLLVAGLSLGAWAVQPPELMNYQGVLRNSSDAPLTGTFDMVFRFYSALTAGDEILIDVHASAGAVSVTRGLFNTQLGGGAVSDGAGPGTYTLLSRVFRDYRDVYLDIEVNGETLMPRVPILSAAFALNAANVDRELDRAQRVHVGDDFLSLNSLSNPVIISEQSYHSSTDLVSSDPAGGENGIIQLDCCDQYLALGAGPADVRTPFLATKADLSVKFRFAPDAFGVGSNARCLVGLSELPRIDGANNGVYVRVTQPAGGPWGNFIAVVEKDGVETILDTGVPGTTGVFQVFEMKRTGPASYEVLVDGISRGVISATLPTALMTFAVHGGIHPNNDGKPRLDYWQVSYDR